jgi:large subunit ribosomal protein L6
MSRIAKQPIPIPSGVTALLNGGLLSVKGPKGELSRSFLSEINMTIEDNAITLVPRKTTIFLKALWGTYASHVKNMIEGVTKGFEKKLVVEGIGFKAVITGSDLVLSLGFSHPIKLAIPKTLKVLVEKSIISISGPDKEEVGQFAAFIRSHKKPEPYKGKGIRYEKEVVRRKQGKKATA